MHTCEMPLSADALDLLPDVARRAHRFAGADLLELSRGSVFAIAELDGIEQRGQVIVIGATNNIDIGRID